MVNTSAKLYITYEEPLAGQTFTEKQMHEVYRDLADRTEYPDFNGWIIDMLKSGVFETINVDMNSFELTQTLFTIASNYNPREWEYNYIVAIINAIIAHYMTCTGYYPENAIYTFIGFLEKGVITW